MRRNDGIAIALILLFIVAARCGYQSDQTFRRGFKRVMGCTPGQVRK
ncbi:MAG: helix-turn-helix transcriptional regulator [Clostridia bacterium]|nr:helix-turn-helix transcriptional regulator [Clostridia bacterium]